MPDPHAHHPAITRGHYEVKTFTVGRISEPNAAGHSILHVIGKVPMMLRVVVAGVDLQAYLPDVPEDEAPQDLTSDEFVQLVAPYLREGLIDPWKGRGSNRTPPIIAMETEAGLSFIQAVACLN
ncbi:MAG TPA: hypothetical protein VGB53_00880 [Rubricoccaceae bacterium]|jgi:hypothetical protein